MMLIDAFFQIIRVPGVVAAVGAFQDVDVKTQSNFLEYFFPPFDPLRCSGRTERGISSPFVNFLPVRGEPVEPGISLSRPSTASLLRANGEGHF